MRQWEEAGATFHTASQPAVVAAWLIQFIAIASKEKGRQKVLLLLPPGAGIYSLAGMARKNEL